MKTTLLTLLAALLLAPSALAVPLQMPLQGVLRDNAGAPVAEGTFAMTFNIYGSADAEEALWTETREVTVGGGQFRLDLGEDTPIQPSLFATSGTLWLGVTVETEPELPRRPMGTTPYAFQAGSASGLNCSGCVEPEALSPASLQVVREEALVAVAEAGYPLAAADMPVDGGALGVAAEDVQGALEGLKDLIDTQTSASNINEGAGSVRTYANQWALSAYGTARDYIHVIHPSPPKVMLHLYGEQAGGAGGSDDLVVAYDFAPNDYSSGAGGNAGESALLVDNPSIFATGSHILLHQSVGGSGTDTGTWEVASVVAVNGNTLQLVQPLGNTYVSDEAAKAQVVVGASFGHIELVNGGSLRPSIPLAADGSKGGIVYVRANKITVRSGGVVSADGMGYSGGSGGYPVVASTMPGSGGFAANSCGGSGGGSNQVAGQPGEGADDCPEPGAPGALQSGGATPLLFGGHGGQGASASVSWPAGASGGGIVVLGAQTIIAQEGAKVTADGDATINPAAGGGAGGTVALFTEQAQVLTDVSAAGGAGGPAAATSGVFATEGWAFVDSPTQNDSMNFDTHSHGGGYHPVHNEFWYPQWSGDLVYRHTMSGGQVGSFSSGQNNIMGLWGDVDGSYYTCNWGNNTVHKWKSLDEPQTELWSYNLGSTAGGVCSDGAHVYAAQSSGPGIWKLSVATGELVEQFDLSGGSFGSIYGGLICLPGRLLRANNSPNTAYLYDLETRQLIDEFPLDEAPNNVSFDGKTLWISANDTSLRGFDLVTEDLYDLDILGNPLSSGAGGAGGAGHNYETSPIPGIVNESYPKGVKILVDGQDVTAALGDPNAKGSDHWDATTERWGSTGLEPWSTGPLDLTNATNWTLGEHTLEFEESGGAGGAIKSYLYLIQPFSESTPPQNDTCQTPLHLDLSEGPVVLGGTTEDIMGKTLATDAHSDASCGGAGGPDVVYQITLSERALINAVVTAPFYARMYVRSADCSDGELVYCGANELQTTPLEAGEYFLFVDSDASSQKGDFTLAVSLTSAVLPDNDTCEAPMALFFSPSGVATDASSTLYSLDQYQSWCDLEGGGPDVVYSFTAGTSQSITATVQSLEFQPTLILYKGECGTAEPYTCSPDGDLFVANQPGGEYFLVVDGTDEKEWGSFDLTVTLQ